MNDVLNQPPQVLQGREYTRNGMGPWRIVLVFNEAPIPDSPAGRWGHLLMRGLVSRGHLVSAVCLGSASQASQMTTYLPRDQYDWTFVQRDKGRALSVMHKVRSWLRHFGDCLPDEFTQAVRRQVAEGCDIIHVDQLAAGWGALPYASRAVIFHLCIYRADLALEQFTSWRRRLAIWRMLRAERYLCRRFANHIAITDRVAEEVRKLAPAKRICVAPISVDFEGWPFISDAQRNHSEPRISLFTNARWTPGILAVRRLCGSIWPRILAAVPNAKLQLVGPGMRSLIEIIGSVENLEAHDYVEDIAPFWAQAGVLVYAPEVGTGIKTKLLEAMAYGVPIVTNAQGAEGLGFIHGEHAMMAEDDEPLAKHATDLIRNPELQNHLRHSARHHLETQFSAEAVLQRFELCYASFLSGK